MQQKAMSPGGIIQLMPACSALFILITAEPVQGLTTMFGCVGFTWQDFDRGEVEQSCRGDFCEKTPEAVPHIRQNQFQPALKQTHCCAKLSPAVMLVVPL